MKAESKQVIKIEQIQPGVFIQVEGKWFSHPFLFNKFMVKSWNQVEILEKMGVKEVFWVPEKSDMLPLEIEKRGKAEPAAPEPRNLDKTVPDDPYLELLWRVKKERVIRLKQMHENLRQCTHHYERVIKNVPNLMDQMVSGSVEALSSVRETVEGIVDDFLGDTDTMVHLINIKEKEETIYHHSLNVSILALMLGRKAKLTTSEMHELGMGALFHDIGKNRIEKKILKKKAPLTKAELAVMRLHPRYGVDIMKKCGVRDGVLRVIYGHHELFNGRGYPSGLKGEEISKLSRILSIANIYDNLCNHPEPEKCLTPYEALSHMFTKKREHMDMELFSTFIRAMGIYPPGTVVQLSNGEVAIVISINPENPLKPSLLLYEPNIPKDEALIHEMADDDDITIEKSIRTEELKEEVRRYLSASRHVTYFMDKGQKPRA